MLIDKPNDGTGRQYHVVNLLGQTVHAYLDLDAAIESLEGSQRIVVQVNGEWFPKKPGLHYLHYLVAAEDAKNRDDKERKELITGNFDKPKPANRRRKVTDYWFPTLNAALESEGLVHLWPLGTNISYNQSVQVKVEGRFISVYRNDSGLYERPVHYKCSENK